MNVSFHNILLIKAMNFWRNNFEGNEKCYPGIVEGMGLCCRIPWDKCLLAFGWKNKREEIRGRNRVHLMCFRFCNDLYFLSQR